MSTSTLLRESVTSDVDLPRGHTFVACRGENMVVFSRLGTVLRCCREPDLAVSRESFIKLWPQGALSLPSTSTPIHFLRLTLNGIRLPLSSPGAVALSLVNLCYEPSAPSSAARCGLLTTPASDGNGVTCTRWQHASGLFHNLSLRHPLCLQVTVLSMSHQLSPVCFCWLAGTSHIADKLSLTR